VGQTQIPKKEPNMKKLHYQIQQQTGLSKEFRQSVYKVYAEPELVIVHYTGNASAAVDFPHGNAKRPVNFVPTAKLVTEKLADKNKKLADIRIESAAESEHYQPRNVNQKRYFERKSQITTDSFLVLHELAYMLPGFVWSITTFPDMVVLFGLPEFLSMLDKCKNDILLMTYDTTFNLGDFYVTTLVVQMTSFTERPIMPVAFMLHERKFQKFHVQFCEGIAEHLSPAVAGMLLHICTDGESGCSNAIQEVFPSWIIFNCWNHIVRDVEFWLKKHGAGKDEMSVYKLHVRNLLSSSTEEEYSMTLNSYRQTWSQAFAEYFDGCLEKRVVTSCKTKLCASNYTQDSITTNNAESMNAVIKHFQDFKEVPVDKLVYSMYRLQLSYGLQLNKSIRGFGPFTPANECQLAALQLPECAEYDDMLQSLPTCTFRGVTPDTVTDIARMLKVVHVPEHQCFSVSTRTGVVHSVKLFPKESCTCPVSKSCCHIQAAKSSVGISSAGGRQINLGQLRRNSRKKA